MQAANHQIRIGERLSIPETILLLRIVCGYLIAGFPGLLEISKQHVAFPLRSATFVRWVFRLLEKRQRVAHFALLQKSESVFVASSPCHSILVKFHAQTEPRPPESATPRS